ncbi:MAG: hypothetical protein GY820_27810 [Gammaproteobacteria bacterium]|nr:hypothetical protein [Gammaproteobacteria bacterium]
MRQREDGEFASLCNRLREGNQTEEDVKLLESRKKTKEEAELMLATPGIVFLTTINRQARQCK